LARHRFIAIYLPLGILGVVMGRIGVGEEYWSDQLFSAWVFTVEFGMLAALGSIALLVFGYIFIGIPDAIHRRRWIKASHQICIQCGYDLRMTRDVCPECGMRKPPMSVIKLKLQKLDERNIWRRWLRWIGLNP
jgi:hypothetical protein